MLTTSAAAAQATAPVSHFVASPAPTREPHCEAGTAAQQWHLAIHIAGRPTVRIGRPSKKRNGKLVYDVERALTAEVDLKRPLAATIYSRAGYCRTLCLDLDAKHGASPDEVLTETTALVNYLAGLGIRTVHDVSPNGGRHVYIPLLRPMKFDDAKDVVAGLKTMFASLDPNPHLGIDAGCIRTPGARHASGNHQSLTMPLEDAAAALTQRNDSEVVSALVGALEQLPRPVQPIPPAEPALETTTPPLLDKAQAPVTECNGRMSPAIREIAVNAIWDPLRYQTSSEARMAVINSAVSCGFTVTDIQRHMVDGTWPGLAYLYRHTRDTAAQRVTLLRAEYAKAQAWISARITAEQVHGIDTSQPSQRGGGGVTQEHRFIRVWNAVADEVLPRRWRGADSHSRRWLMRTLAVAAHMSASRETDFGTRSLAESCGSDHSTVAKQLHLIAEDGWAIKVLDGRGVFADTWRLTLPDDVADLAEYLPVPRDKTATLPAAFHSLGHVAAWAFDAVAYREASSVSQVQEVAGMSKRAAIEAVSLLEDHGLITRSPAGLHAHVERLEQVARKVGAYDVIAAQRAQHRADRDTWKQWLATALAAKLALEPPFELYLEPPSMIEEDVVA